MTNLLRRIKSNRIMQILIIGIIIILGILLFSYFRANPVLPQLTIHFLSDVELPEEGQTVLVVAPHPDDETIACGGYIIESVKRGARVIITLITDGNRRSLRDLRYVEFTTATNILGIPIENLVFLNYPDSRLAMLNQQELQEVLTEQMEEYKPDILFYPHPEDYHKDHSTTGIIMEKILEEMLKSEELKPPIFAYKYLVHHTSYPHPKKYAPDLFLLPPLDLITLEGGWERFMLSEDTKQLKEKALRAHVSQLRNPLLRNLLESSIRENEIFAVWSGSGFTSSQNSQD